MKITRPRILLMVALGLVVLAGAGLLWGQATLLQAGVMPSAGKDCPVSPITTERPENANTAAWSKTWYRSLDGRIWASAPGLQSYRPEGDKVLWVKPSGSDLEVKGAQTRRPGGPVAGPHTRRLRRRLPGERRHLPDSRVLGNRGKGRRHRVALCGLHSLEGLSGSSRK